MKLLNHLKLSAVSFFLLLCLGYSNAQNSTVGLNVGPSISCIRGDDFDDDFDPLMGMGFGLFYQYNFSDNFAFHTGLMYERKGFAFRTEFDLGPFGGETTTIYRSNFDYLNIPILFRAHFLPTGGPRLFVNAGPFLGFLLAQNNTTIVKNNDDRDVEHERGDLDELRKFDIGLSAGVGVQFPLGDRFNLGVEARNNLSFGNIVEDDDAEPARFNNALLLVSFSMNIGGN